MFPDLDIYGAAYIRIRRPGEDAPIEAAMRSAMSNTASASALELDGHLGAAVAVYLVVDAHRHRVDIVRDLDAAYRRLCHRRAVQPCIAETGAARL